MSRMIKNAIMGLLIFGLIITSCLTIRFAVGITKDFENEKAGVMNGFSNNDDFTDISNEQQVETLPAKPSEDMNEGTGMERPSTIPEAGKEKIEKDNIEEEDIEKKEDENFTMPTEFNVSRSVEPVYYVLFGVQSLILAMLVVYMIMSLFNKKTFRETFASSDKIIIYILGIMLLTICLTMAESCVTKCILNKTSQEMTWPGNNARDTDTDKREKESEGADNIAYSGANEFLEDTEITSGKFISSEADENVILAGESAQVSIEDVTVTKSGDSDGGDNTSFYGTNSAILARDGAVLTLRNLAITTDATGANGVFSYGGYATTKNASSDGTTVNIYNSTITTTKDNSGGIMTTGGGTTNAYDLTVDTSGVSSAAIRSDRGGGVVNVDGGTYTTTGSGSPCVYSTAEISVKNATLYSKVAEGIVVEGKNSVVLEKCDLISNNTELNGLSTTYKNIFLYQSMSGDADSGNSSFAATDSVLQTNNGDTFYITNTSSTIKLTHNTIINNDKMGNFLRAKADSWGKEGENGGNVELILSNQEVTGDIVIDEVSTLDMTMENGSYYEGAINTSKKAKSLTIKLDKTSKIKLTRDSYITSLENEDTSNSNIDFNGYSLYVNGEAVN